MSALKRLAHLDSHSNGRRHGSGQGIGSLKTTMTPSPMMWISVPWKSLIKAAQRGVILRQHSDLFFWLSDFGECGEIA